MESQRKPEETRGPEENLGKPEENLGKSKENQENLEKISE